MRSLLWFPRHREATWTSVDAVAFKYLYPGCRTYDLDLVKLGIRCVMWHVSRAGCTNGKSTASTASIASIAFTIPAALACPIASDATAVVATATASR